MSGLFVDKLVRQMVIIESNGRAVAKASLGVTWIRSSLVVSLDGRILIV